MLASVQYTLVNFSVGYFYSVYIFSIKKKKLPCTKVSSFSKITDTSVHLEPMPSATVLRIKFVESP